MESEIEKESYEDLPTPESLYRTDKKFKMASKKLFSLRGVIEDFWKEQPFFYDKSKMFWIWDKENYKWILSDETDFLILIQKALEIETLNSKTKNELIEGFRQIGREHLPEPNEKEWVQFLDTIYDLKTDRSFKATPKYFFTNPIPFKVGEKEETPTIDKLFIDWVGEEHKQELYEFIYYSICQDRFMQRIFAFCGGGSNGKGTFIKIHRKFIGKDNCVSTELKQLAENQFETAIIYKKLLCIMGEVSYDDLKNTNIIKQIAGEDNLRFCFKGKTPFTSDNTCLGVCLTNSLPITPDKSLGFYRKWKVLDFPNQFSEISKDLIAEIPEEEFENLALKSLNGLKKLYKERKFTNEGDFDERIKRYEERSNPVMRFVEENCEEVAGEHTILKNFVNYCNVYLKKNHLRTLNVVQVGKILRNEGFSVGARRIDDISSVVIQNLKVKTIGTIGTIQNPTRFPCIQSNSDLDSSNSSNSSQRELFDKKPEIVKIGDKNEV